MSQSNNRYNTSTCGSMTNPLCYPPILLPNPSLTIVTDYPRLFSLIRNATNPILSNPVRETSISGSAPSSSSCSGPQIVNFYSRAIKSNAVGVNSDNAVPVTCSNNEVNCCPETIELLGASDDEEVTSRLPSISEAAAMPTNK